MGIFNFLKNNITLNINRPDLTVEELHGVDLAEKLFLTLAVSLSINNSIEEKQINSILSECETRQDVLLKIIELCGDISTPKERYLVAKAYAWSKVKYRLQAIKYLELYLNNELYEGAYKNHHHSFGSEDFSFNEERDIHLAEMYNYLGKAYEGEYEFGKALDCYNIGKNLTPFWASGYCYICTILVKQNKLAEAMSIYLDAQKSPYYKPFKFKDLLGRTFTEDGFKTVIDGSIADLQKKIEKGYIYKPRKVKSKDI